MATTTHSPPPGLREETSELDSLPSGFVEAPPPRLLSVQAVVRELPELLERAQEATGSERSTRALQLNRHLEALASEGGSREVADVLLRLLEGGQLEGLKERRGRTCRSVAVETLLRLGFPYALEVRPEDLEHLRQQVPRHKRQRISPEVGSAIILGLSLPGQWLTFPPDFLSGSTAAPVIAMMGLQLLALLAALLGGERSDARRAGLWVLALVSLLQLFTGLLGFFPGLLGGFAGLLAWLLLWLPRR